MAYESPLQILQMITGASFASGAGIGSTCQGLFVKMRTQDPDTPGSDNTVIVCTATTDNPIGVAAGNAGSGKAVPVIVAGVAKVVAGGTVKAGQEVGTDASGKAVVKAGTSTGANYGQFVRGTTLDDGVSGDVIAVLLSPYYRIH